MPAVKLDKSLSVEACAILSTLLYYDIFNYPLTLAEIQRNCRADNCAVESIQSELKLMLELNMIYQFGEFYSIQNNIGLVDRRVAGNKRADRLMKRARRMSRFIGRFPYVRAVCLSGSISKGYVDLDSDIDYFIITKPGRLWLARTMLIMFKKIFLLNSYKYFCVNYFVDTEHLTIEEQNLFTATEVVTLKPTYGSEHYLSFHEANAWAYDIFPNQEPQDVSDVKKHRRGIFKTIQEGLLNNRLGDSLDRYFMKKTMRFWGKKFSHFNADEYDVALKSRTYVSKHHPSNFQKRVISAHDERIAKFEEQFNVVISQKHG